MSTMQRVRQAISESHDTIEKTDFALSLMDGRITRDAYGLYLAQIKQIHLALEQLMPTSQLIASYFQPSMVRTPAIESDAIALGQNLAQHKLMPMTVSITEQMKTWASSAPHALLGCLYILEGSRMGSMMIGRVLIKGLQLSASPVADRASVQAPPTPGVHYHLEDASNTPRRVKELKAAIDSANLSNQHEQELTLGACMFMQMLLDLYKELPVSLSDSRPDMSRCPFASTLGGASVGMVPVSNLRSA